VTQGGRGACICRSRAGGKYDLAQRCCVVVQKGGGVEVGVVVATINNSDFETGGGLLKLMPRHCCVAVQQAGLE
jgi:hypothetical protein